MSLSWSFCCSLRRAVIPMKAPATAASPPTTAVVATYFFSDPYDAESAAAQAAPLRIRAASAEGAVRFGVNGSLSAINSPRASAEITDAAEFLLKKRKRRPGEDIHRSCAAQVTAAGAVIERRPATAPIPIASAISFFESRMSARPLFV